MQLRKILVAVDGSEYSMRAGSYAADMAKLMDSEILLIHCHKPFPIVLGEPYFQNAINKIMKKSNELLDPYRKIIQDAGVEFVDRILEGPPAPAICKVAEVEKADMIIMGCRGRSDLEGLLLGSCTHRVLKTAPCPVLVIR
jgi:nucleotide-binding universal stress UspA family protein